MKASPGSAYNYIIKGRHPYLGEADIDLVKDIFPDFADFKATSSWLKATSYKNKVLALQKTDGVCLIYTEVPPWKVKALHFFAKQTIDHVAELTDEELHDLLERSLEEGNNETAN
jgi:hypothetical protein